METIIFGVYVSFFGGVYPRLETFLLPILPPILWEVHPLEDQKIPPGQIIATSAPAEGIPPNGGLVGEVSPKIPERFRFGNYSNLPRFHQSVALLPRVFLNYRWPSLTRIPSFHSPFRSSGSRGEGFQKETRVDHQKCRASSTVGCDIGGSELRRHRGDLFPY